MLNARVREVLDGRHVAHLVTLNADGTPHVTVIWVGVDGDEIVSGHLDRRQHKLMNVRRDPRVALSLETGTRNDHGLDEYVVIYGTARLEEGGAPELLQQLAYTYIGDVKFPAMDRPPPGITLRITPESVRDARSS
jgi:PPOX class probable F420-dependent enzyme